MLNRRFFLVLFLITIPLIAQEKLNLREAWQFAIENNLSLQQQQKTIQQAQHQLKIQKTGYLPTLSARASYSHVSELAQLELPRPIPGISNIEAGVEDQYDLATVLTQPVFTGFRTKNLIESAWQQQQAQQIQEAVLKNQLLLQVGLLYYQIQQNLLQQEVFQEGLQRVDYRLLQVRNFYLADQATAFDTLEAANRKLQLRSQLQNLSNIYRVQLTQLKHLLNTDQPLVVEREELITEQLSLQAMDEYLAEAMKARPEMQQIRALQQARQFQTSALRSSYFPQVFAQASYHYARPGVNFFSDEWMDYYTIGVNLQWELWNWKRDQRKVAQSELEYQKLDLQLRQLQKDVRQQVTEAYELLQNARQQIEVQQRLVLQERERYRITQQQYTEGQATHLDLSIAEKALTEAELKLQQNYIEWHRYKLRLAFATGNIDKLAKL